MDSEVEYWKEQCFNACMNNGHLDDKVILEFLRSHPDAVPMTKTEYGCICPLCKTCIITQDTIKNLRHVVGHKDPVGEPGVEGVDGIPEKETKDE